MQAVEDVRSDVLRVAFARLSTGDVDGFCSAWLDDDVITIDRDRANPVGTAAVAEDYTRAQQPYTGLVWRVDQVLVSDRHTIALVSGRPWADAPVVVRLCEIGEWQDGVVVVRQLYRER